MSKKPSLFKKIIRNLDFFGESFTFTFKDEDKHSTILGGVVCILFFFFALLYMIYNFFPYKNNEIFSLQYYSMNHETEEIKLSEAPLAFAFGFSDNNNKSKTPYNLSDLFDINVKIKNKTQNITLDHHPCLTSDFHNIHNKSFNDLKIFNYQCLSSKDLISPRGIYTDKFFTYYIISVESKYKNNETHNQIINDYLIEYDCKLQFYYTDYTININSTKNPFSSFLNSMFLQLNPILIQKRNIFFMNYHLFDDNRAFHFDRKDDKHDIKAGLSRIEDYSIYKGLNRTVKKVEDYEAYAKLYLRVDNIRIEIKRRYQDFMEYYADSSSLLLSIFWILGKIFAYYDKIKANHSISKKLFYFEGIKDNNEFKELKDLKRILNQNNEQQIEEIQTHNKNDAINSKNIIINENFKRENTNLPMNEPENKNSQSIDFNKYNIFEMLLSFKFCICKTKKMKLKADLIRQARQHIKNKLDIVLYIRNMFIFDLIFELHPENKEIFNFLSRPIIYLPDNKKAKMTGINIDNIPTENSVKINNENKEDIISSETKLTKTQVLKVEGYKTAYKLNKPVLKTSINNLQQKKSQTEVNKNLFNILNNHLKGV